MPEVLKEWPVKPKNADRFNELFDGKIYRVEPAEFDCDTAEELAKAIKYAATKVTPRRYVRLFVTLDGHVVVSRQPSDYVPRSVGGARPTKTR